MLESEPLFSGGLQFYFSHRYESQTRLFDGSQTRANNAGLFTFDYQFGLGLNYGMPRDLPGEWTLSLNLPFIARDMRTVADGRVVGGQLYGVGDLALGARTRYLWWVPGEGRSEEGASLNLGIVTTLPTGATTRELDGARLAPPDQPGEGAVSLTLAHMGAYSNGRFEVIMTTQYDWRSVGIGRAGYDFGDVFSNELELKYRVIQEKFPGNTMFLDLGVIYERADFDRDEGVRVPNSGGQALMLSPKIQWHPRPWWELKARFEVPLWRELNGIQLGKDFSVRASAGIRF